MVDHLIAQLLERFDAQFKSALARVLAWSALGAVVAGGLSLLAADASPSQRVFAAAAGGTAAGALFCGFSAITVCKRKLVRPDGSDHWAAAGMLFGLYALLMLAEFGVIFATVKLW
jgi:hypothetical protein